MSVSDIFIIMKVLVNYENSYDEIKRNAENKIKNSRKSDIILKQYKEKINLWALKRFFYSLILLFFVIIILIVHYYLKLYNFLYFGLAVSAYIIIFMINIFQDKKRKIKELEEFSKPYIPYHAKVYGY